MAGVNGGKDLRAYKSSFTSDSLHKCFKPPSQGSSLSAAWGPQRSVFDATDRDARQISVREAKAPFGEEFLASTSVSKRRTRPSTS